MSDVFPYLDGKLCVGEWPLAEIAERWDTPCYVYSEPAILERYHALADAFGRYRGAVCYAVKANSNLAVLASLARAGSGFDIVSGGELSRVLRAGGDVKVLSPKKMDPRIAKYQNDLWRPTSDVISSN